MNKIIISLVIGLVIGAVGASLLKTDNPVGSIVGPEILTRLYVSEGVTEGGRVATTTTAATYTTNAIDFDGTPTYIDWLPNINTTVSISATSTHNYVPKIGDVATVYLRNASSTAAATITLAAADANTDLQDNEDSADLAIAGLDYAKLTFIREGDYLVTVIVDEFTEAD